MKVYVFCIHRKGYKRWTLISNYYFLVVFWTEVRMSIEYSVRGVIEITAEKMNLI